MSAREMRNLLLEYRSWSEWRGVEAVQFPLANIPGHSYTIGTLYPGEREGEEFIFCRGYKSGLISPSHCTIRVDDRGQYWIQNDGGGKSTISFYDTFVNLVRVEGSESRLLKCGDLISLGGPGTDWNGNGRGHPPHPIYRVKGRAMLSSDLQIEVEAKNDEAESPFDNDLIFAKIMSYLPFRDVKNARLVSKKWKRRASDVLEKKGQVTFTFGVDYLNPKNSTKVSRYFNEMEGLKPRNVRICLRISLDNDYYFNTDPSLGQNPLLLSPGEPGDKMMSDLRKLLSSPHNFSNVFLSCGNIDEVVAHPFSLILQHLGGQLVELHLDGDLRFLPKEIPPLPVLTNLKKVSHDGMPGVKIDQKCVSFLVPLFAGSLEHFRCCKREIVEEHYLQEFVKHEMPKLKGFQWFAELSEKSLSYLLQLKNPLTFLEFSYKNYHSESGRLLEKLLFKHSSSLKRLTMEISHEDDDDDKQIEIKFPPFPKLEELALDFIVAPNKMRITWKSGDLDYKKHFPSLRKLSIVNWFHNSEGFREMEDPVFDSFFPRSGEVRCEAVKYVSVHVAKLKHLRRSTFPNADFGFQGHRYYDLDDEFGAY